MNLALVQMLIALSSKHMDKHERPYKCKVPGCEKLQGFTYSGGLLRHEREVHKLHGGTKTLARCPYPNCKRSSGAGFTRKENLQEHIRRVHRGSTDGSDPLSGADGKRDHDAMEDDSLLEGGEVGASPAEDDVQDNIDPSISGPKRRRIAPATNGTSASNGTATVSNQQIADQIKRLQSNVNLLIKENETIRRQGQTLSERMNRLEEALLNNVNGV
jgi:hypothetical protein